MIVLPPKAFKNRYSISDSAISKVQVPILRFLAEDRKLEIIDVNTPTDSLDFADGVHLSAQGAELLAQIYYESITGASSVQLSKEMLLWPGGAPGALSNTESDKPMLFAHPASDPVNKPAVIICPGGGYGHLSMDHEGHDVAKWLNGQGITAFVLRSRCKPYQHPIPLNDARRAMRMVRHLAGIHGMDSTRIGILGFSAGGHLASTLLTHYDAGNPASPDSIERKKSRPDFGILVYPVITLIGQCAHTGSRDNLLGNSPSQELIINLSNQLQVTPNTPATFMAHGDKDNSVPLGNSTLFDSALKANGVPSELYVDKGKGHAFGLNGQWPESCAKWLGKIEQLSVSPAFKYAQKQPKVRAVVPIGQTGRSIPFSVYFIKSGEEGAGHFRDAVYAPNGKRIRGRIPSREKK
jgi:acetyl esterase/lipase